MKISWRTEWPHWVLLAAMFAAAAIVWPGLPERIPVHWGVDGNPDRYGSRFEGLLIFPLTALLVYALMLWLPRIDPRRENYASFSRPFAFFRFAFILFMMGLQVALIAAARGSRVNMTGVALILMGGLFLVIAYLMRRVQPNWFVGFRTPWTLTSQRSWTATHRAGSVLFAIAGVAFAAAGLVGTAWAFWTALTLLLAGVIGLTVFSYFEWRRDPDRQPTPLKGGTRAA